MIELNLFRSVPPSEDPETIRRNRHTTRVYLLVLFTSLLVISMYTSLRQDTVTIIVNSPSVLTYRLLYMQYPVTLKCPCENIEVKYDKFVEQIEPDYHQVCSSDFISSKWIESLQVPLSFLTTFTYGNDFRGAARLQFMTISRFCDLSRNVVNSSLSIFRQTDLLTTRVISPTEFSVQTEALVEQFKKTMTDQFMQIVKVIQVTNLGNQLATAFSSNWRFMNKYSYRFSSAADDITDLPTLTLPEIYGADDCSCKTSSYCTKLTTIPYPTLNQTLIQTIPGLRIGCFPLDALLQSSLSCLYNKTCLNIIQAAVYYAKPISIEILTYSSFTEPNTTIEKILSQLFVSQWSHQFSFDQYFIQCAPQYCKYAYSTKFNRIYVATTLIAVFGGLSKGLHFIIFCIAFVVFKLFDLLKKKNVVEPYSQQSNTTVIDKSNSSLDIEPMSTMIKSQVVTLSIYILSFFY